MNDCGNNCRPSLSDDRHITTVGFMHMFFPNRPNTIIKKGERCCIAYGKEYWVNYCTQNKLKKF